MNKMIIVATAIIMMFTPAIKGVNHDEAETVQERAEIVSMTEDEFIFISSVVEAESDRSGDIEGRIYIALTILNRVNDSRFPNTISGVLNQPRQFSTVRNNHSIVDRTELSDEAVIEAYEWIERGDAPAVLFFNCVGYNYGSPYGFIGGNYFMTLEDD